MDALTYLRKPYIVNFYISDFSIIILIKEDFNVLIYLNIINQHYNIVNYL